MKQISSIQNSMIKQLVQLKEKSRARLKSGMFLIEGEREIKLAIEGNYQLETLLFTSEIYDISKLEKLIGALSKPPEVIELSLEVYQKLAYRGSTQGLIAVVKSKDFNLEQLTINSKTPLILIAEAPEKPGNIGALLRTADAAKADAVIIANPKTDLFNPNIIRSSVGCVFTNHIAMGGTSEIINFLISKNINIYCAALQASKPYTDCDFKKASAIVVGTEDQGLSDLWLEKSTQNIIIPMSGKIDSMNVSVAAGILIFEAKRQRGFS